MFLDITFFQFIYYTLYILLTLFILDFILSIIYLTLYKPIYTYQLGIGSNIKDSSWLPTQQQINTMPQFRIPNFKTTGFEPFYRLYEKIDYYEYFKYFFLQIFKPIKIFLLSLKTLISILLIKFGEITNTIPPKISFIEKSKLNVSWLQYINSQYQKWITYSMAWFCGFSNLEITKLSYKDMDKYFGYKLPNEFVLKYDEYGNEIEPNCYLSVSNHHGVCDILLIGCRCNSGFLSKAAIAEVPIIKSWAKLVNTMFIEKGVSATKQITDRINYTYESHVSNPYTYKNMYNKNKNCGLCKNCDRCKLFCQLCNFRLHIFPEGTTTNGQSMLIFRRGAFVAGKPMIPIVVRSKFKSVNTTWETIWFKELFFKSFLLQFSNNFEILIGPPYIPTKEEMKDPMLYAYNMNILLAKMLGNQDIWLLNRELKTKWHHIPVFGWSVKKAFTDAKKMWKDDKIFHEYIKLIKKDPRYKKWKLHGIAKDIENKDNPQNNVVS